MTNRLFHSAADPGAVRFGVPIVLLLLLLAVLTVGLLRVAVDGQDRVAREASTTIARAALGSERDSVAGIARDYSWWNAAVENLIFDFNAAWAENNLDWLPQNFDISRVYVFDPERRLVYTTNGDGAAGQPSWQEPGFMEIVERAQGQPHQPEAATTAYAAFSGAVHLVSASQILQETEEAGHPSYPQKGVLVLTREIDAGLVDRIAGDYRLSGLEITRDRPETEDTASLPLRGPTGKPVAYMAWNPPRPGTELLQWLGLPLAAAFMLVGAVIAVIIARARRASLVLRQALEARLATQKQLEHMARHDSLTDLPNRTLFLEHLVTAIAHNRRYDTGFALHYLDLDGFKAVNDTHGHPAGDDLLRELARRLNGVVRAADTIARFGGDEFAVLQRGTNDPRDARLLAQRLIDVVDEPFHIAGHTVRVTLSVGIAFDYDSDDPETIIQEADRALYRAKRQGGNGLAFFDAGLDSGASGIASIAHGPDLAAGTR